MSDVEHEEAEIRAPSAKKAKIDGAGFVDEMAEVSGDDEPEEEEVEEEGPNEYEVEAEEIDDDPSGLDHIKFDRLREEGVVSAEVSAIRERYKLQKEKEKQTREATRMLEGGGGRALVQDLMPSLRDPRLYAVPVGPKYTAEEILPALLSEFFRTINSKDRLYIFSAFTQPSCKGLIYVEADKKDHVIAAARRVRGLNASKISDPVPISEMTQALTIVARAPQIAPNSWVRMKGGVYKGDLALVTHTADQGSILSVKLVPRLDLSAIEAKRREKQAGETVDRKRKKAPRPQPALVDYNQLRQAVPDLRLVQTGIGNKSGYTIGGKAVYRDGFVFMEVPVAQVIKEGIQPPRVDELELFRARLKYEDLESDDEATSLPSDAGFVSLKFHIGDPVIITKGSDKNVHGTVARIERGLVWVEPHAEFNLKNLLQVSPNDCKKYFKVGDNVKIIEGDNVGETGFVEKVYMDAAGRVDIHGTLNRKTIQCTTQQLQLSEETYTTRDSLGGYEAFDMIQLGDATRTVALIKLVEINSMRVLTVRGEEKSIKLQDVARKLSSASTKQTDKHNHTITVGTLVNVVGGEHKGKSGTIKHIWGHFVFLRSLKDGVFVTVARDLSVTGAALNSDRGGEPRALEPRGRGRGPPDEYIQKKVIITTGPHKGHRGKVLDARPGDTYRVMLAHISKIITVRKVALKIIDAAPTAQGQQTYVGSQTPRDPGAMKWAQTPYRGAATPGWTNRTPQHPGARTPSYAGGRTPSHAGGRTPHHGDYNPNAGGETNVWASETPKIASRTPARAEEAEPEGEEAAEDFEYAMTDAVPPAPPAPAVGEAEAEEEPEHVDYVASSAAAPAASSSSSIQDQFNQDDVDSQLAVGDDVLIAASHSQNYGRVAKIKAIDIPEFVVAYDDGDIEIFPRDELRPRR